MVQDDACQGVRNQLNINWTAGWRETTNYSRKPSRVILGLGTGQQDRKYCFLIMGRRPRATTKHGQGSHVRELISFSNQASAVDYSPSHLTDADTETWQSRVKQSRSHSGKRQNQI